MNSVVVVGNVGAEPEIRATRNGAKVASFRIAVNRGFGDSKKTSWFNVTAWRALADQAENLHKGDRLHLSGYLQSRDWEDKSGVKRTTVEIVAQAFEIQPKRDDEKPKQSPEPDSQIDDDSVPF
jgi:single-strand DNA-binding protein